MKTMLVLLVVVAVIAGGGFWYWKHQSADAPDYKTATVTRGDLIQSVTATGQLNPETNVTVGSQVSGIISRLFADYNSPVTNGQLVAQIDPITYNAAVAQATADLESSKAALAYAQVSLDRDEALMAKNILAKSDYDQAKATCDQAKAMVSIKTASLATANANLAYTKIYAPIDGIVLSRNVDVGQTVAASFSAPTLFVIANDLTQMQIDALVSEADIGSIKTNQAVNFTVDAFPTETFHGIVKQIRNSPSTNQNVVSYDSVITVDNSKLLLRPGMTANVAIITAQQNGALRIPNTALRYRPPDAADPAAAAGGPQAARGGPGASGGPGAGGGGGGAPRGDGTSGRSGGRGRGGRGGKTIYVLAEGTNGGGSMAKPVQIRTGIGDGVFTEVVDGLKEGDEVITGQNNAVSTAAGSAAPSNPFGGGQRRF